MIYEIAKGNMEENVALFVI